MEHPNESKPLRLTELSQEFKAMSDLGSPKDRLMAILTKDNDIKQWFAERIGDIMHYQNRTYDQMSEFFEEILNSHKNLKKNYSLGQQDKYDVKFTPHHLEIYHQEYNIEKICGSLN